MAYFGSCCENKLKSKEKAEAAICSFGKLAFFSKHTGLQCSFNEKTHYQTAFFSKSTFTKKFTKHSADLFHSRLFSQHSRLFSQQLFFKAQQYQTSPKRHASL